MKRVCNPSNDGITIEEKRITACQRLPTSVYILYSGGNKAVYVGLAREQMNKEMQENTPYTFQANVLCIKMPI